MGSLTLHDRFQPTSGVQITTEKIGVMIYEREPLVRHGLCSMIGAFDRTYVLREICEPTAPVVIPPTKDGQVQLVGPSLIGHLSAIVSPSAAPVVALVTGTSYAEFNQVQRSGVRGLVLIDQVSYELEYAIETVAAGRPFLSAPFTSRILDWMSDRSVCDEGHRASAQVDLTDRECEVLILLGRGRTNSEIARELNIQDATVRTHLCHILAKLNLRNRTAAVLYAIRSELYGCFI